MDLFKFVAPIAFKSFITPLNIFSEVTKQVLSKMFLFLIFIFWIGFLLANKFQIPRRYTFFIY